MKLSLAAAATFQFVLAKTAKAATSWSVLTDTKLPVPLSDHSSTYVPANGSSNAAIYIAGGCDSPNGNTYVDANGLELDFFLCESYSDKLFAFDTNSFDTRAKMPRPRYRHAAVSAAGKLWLVGGRTIPEDTVIAEVDVYDPATDSWSTAGTIPEAYLTSDNGAFASADGSTVYVVGGFNPQYFAPDALATTFSFATAEALVSAAADAASGGAALPELAITRRADLGTQRGDIHAVASGDGTVAYVAGGYSGMCQPLASAEVYDFDTDAWTSAGRLLEARGDGAMVEAGGAIFAIGGEINHPDQCAAPELVPPLAHQSLAVNDVEALEYTAGSANTAAANAAEWADVGDIPEFRFRFSAASWPATGIAYAFGGQTSFDESCKCFPTTDEITALDSETLLAAVGGAGEAAAAAAAGTTHSHDEGSGTTHSHSDTSTIGTADDAEKNIISEMGDEGYIFDDSAAPTAVKAFVGAVVSAFVVASSLIAA